MTVFRRSTHDRSQASYLLRHAGMDVRAGGGTEMNGCSRSIDPRIGRRMTVVLGLPLVCSIARSGKRLTNASEESYCTSALHIG